MGNQEYEEASRALADYDENAGKPGFDPAISNQLEQAKHEASENASAWTRFWNP